MNKPSNIEEMVAAYIAEKGEVALLCPKCRKRLRKVYWDGRALSVRLTCGQKECHHMFGRKRPEHSKAMKELAKTGSEAYRNTLMKKGELFNKEVNTINFLRKKLSRRGYEVTHLTDDEVRTLNGLEESRRTLSLQHKVKSTLSRYASWEQKYKTMCLDVTEGIEPSLEYFSSLDEVGLRKVLSQIHGINTIRNGNVAKVSRSKWFDTGIMSGFKHNMDGLNDVYVRSGLEREYIRLFESRGWSWSYENIHLMTPSGKFYTPDFLVKIGSKTYLLEAKGSFYRQDKESYLKNEVQTAIRYCREQGYVYILSQVARPNENLNFIKEALINSEKQCD